MEKDYVSHTCIQTGWLTVIRLVEANYATRLHRDCCFLLFKVLLKFQWDYPPVGVTNMHVVGKICNFQQITCYISKVVQDGHSFC